LEKTGKTEVFNITDRLLDNSRPQLVLTYQLSHVIAKKQTLTTVHSLE